MRLDGLTKPFEPDMNGADDAGPETTTRIRATPYRWIDPEAIPPRQWLYGRHLIRKFLSATIAPGGVGKSSLAIVEHLSMVTGRTLLIDRAPSPLRCWYWNGEDPRDELDRRIAAACLHYGIGRAEIEGRLFVDTGRETPIVIASENRAGLTIARPVVDAVIATIRENGIDVFTVDPFVSAHRVSENDNSMIQAVAEQWAAIADAIGCAVDLIHHPRKANGGELTAEDARGASALVAKTRSVRVLNRMTKGEAERAGLSEPKLHFRIDSGKANLAPPSDKAEWCRLVGVDLGNGGTGPGDNVGVVTSWQWPDLFQDVTPGDLRRVQLAIDGKGYRENVQASEWIGHPIAEVLGLDAGDKAAKQKIKTLLKTWTATGALVVVDGRDERGKKRPIVEVGEWVNS